LQGGLFLYNDTLMITGMTTMNTEPTTESGTTLVADGVIERIERLITHGVLKVGEPLPSERSLSEKLGVSRTALREALGRLRGMGIVATAHGKGSYVTRLSRDVDTSPLLHLFGTQPRTLYDLMEVRAVLESEASRLAALRATQADLVMIRRRFEEMQQADQTLSREEHARRDHAFHRSINEASHNPILVHTLDSLEELMLHSVFASVCNLYHRPALKKIIDRQHQRLFSAIEAHDTQLAARVSREHIEGLKEMFMEIEQDEQRLDRARMRLEADDRPE
jgi:GntR family transcriptional regulator, glc operon transcriptional activator